MSAPYRMIIRSFGGPEVIERESFDPGRPGEGQLLVENEAVGLNFIDTYYRTGLYDAPLPITLGSESAGKVIAEGPGVSGFAVGDRVGSVLAGGAYTTHRITAAAQTVKIPDGVSAEDAAAAMLKGFTACYLAEDILPLGPGSSALVHSAAGGVGSILVPWLRDKGVKVVAHVGSAEKAKLVEADVVLSGDLADLPGPVKEASGGGVDVVFDGVGKDSWAASLACLKRRGMMVSYGNASGAVPPVSLLDLMKGGSLFVTRPTMGDFIAAPEALANTAKRLFDRLESGVVKAQIGQRFALEDAAKAHEALQARKTTGSTVLLP
jgi:NADPH2:quinone reductase